MKQKTIVILLIICATIGLVVYFFKDNIKNLFKKKSVEPAPVATTNTVYIHDKTPPIVKASHTIDYWSLDKNKVLKKGSKGDEVTQLQNMINQALKIKKQPYITSDGGFGAKTENALKYLTGKTQITLAQAASLFVAAISAGYSSGILDSDMDLSWLKPKL